MKVEDLDIFQCMDLECPAYMEMTTALEARLRKFNPLKCAECGGHLYLRLEDTDLSIPHKAPVEEDTK